MPDKTITECRAQFPEPLFRYGRPDPALEIMLGLMEDSRRTYPEVLATPCAHGRSLGATASAVLFIWCVVFARCRVVGFLCICGPLRNGRAGSGARCAEQRLRNDPAAALRRGLGVSRGDTARQLHAERGAIADQWYRCQRVRLGREGGSTHAYLAGWSGGAARAFDGEWGCSRGDGDPSRERPQPPGELGECQAHPRAERPRFTVPVGHSAQCMIV